MYSKCISREMSNFFSSEKFIFIYFHRTQPFDRFSWIPIFPENSLKLNFSLKTFNFPICSVPLENYMFMYMSRKFHFLLHFSHIFLFFQFLLQFQLIIFCLFFQTKFQQGDHWKIEIWGGKAKNRRRGNVKIEKFAWKKLGKRGWSGGNDEEENGHFLEKKERKWCEGDGNVRIIDSQYSEEKLNM